MPEAALMTLSDRPLRSKPVGRINPLFATALLPNFMRPLGDLFFQTELFVHLEHRCGLFVIWCRFHLRGTFGRVEFASEGKAVAA